MKTPSVKLSLQNITQKYEKNALHPALDNVSADVYDFTYANAVLIEF